MFNNVISPAIDKYVSIQEALQPQDPIGNGAVKGIEAAKSSLSLMPLLRRPPPAARALSAGAAAFKAPIPGSGRAGMMQSMAQAMGPAMESYYREMDTRQALEMELAAAAQKQQNELAEQAYRRDVLGETSRHHKESLAETMRHHKMVEAEHAAERIQEEKYKELEKQLGPGRELIQKYSKYPSMLTFIEKDIQSSTEKTLAAQKGRQALAGLSRIIKQSPELYKKMDVIMLHNQEEDPKFWRQKAIDLKIPKKDWANFQEAGKYTSQLLQAASKSIPAKGMNVYMEKQLSKGIPSLAMVPEAAERMIRHMDKQFEEEEKVGIQKYNDAAQGIWYRTPVSEKMYEEEVSPEDEKQARIQQLLQERERALAEPE